MLFSYERLCLFNSAFALNWEDMCVNICIVYDYIRWTLYDLNVVVWMSDLLFLLKKNYKGRIPPCFCYLSLFAEAGVLKKTFSHMQSIPEMFLNIFLHGVMCEWVQGSLFRKI